MMINKLNKNLPFAKKGKVVFEENNELLVYDEDGKKRFVGYPEFLEDYLREGWLTMHPPRKLRAYFSDIGGLLALFEEGEAKSICLYRKEGEDLSEVKETYFEQTNE